MKYSEKLSTLGIQDIGQRQRKYKTTQTTKYISNTDPTKNGWI